MSGHIRRFRDRAAPGEAFVRGFSGSFEATLLDRRRKQEKEEDRLSRQKERATEISDAAILRDQRDEAEREREAELRVAALKEKRDFFKFKRDELDAEEEEAAKKQSGIFKQIKEIQTVIKDITESEAFPGQQEAVALWTSKLRKLQGVPEGAEFPPEEPGFLSQAAGLAGQAIKGAVRPAIRAGQDLIERIQQPEEAPPPQAAPIPQGRIRVEILETGETGTIDEAEFDPNIYKRL